MFTPTFEEARSHMMPIIKGLRAGLFDSVALDRPDGSIIKVTMVQNENVYLVRRQRKNGSWGQPKAFESGPIGWLNAIWWKVPAEYLPE